MKLRSDEKGSFCPYTIEATLTTDSIILLEEMMVNYYLYI